jgi:hypothetical protein
MPCGRESARQVGEVRWAEHERRRDVEHMITQNRVMMNLIVLVAHHLITMRRPPCSPIDSANRGGPWQGRALNKMRNDADSLGQGKEI